MRVRIALIAPQNPKRTLHVNIFDQEKVTKISMQDYYHSSVSGICNGKCMFFKHLLCMLKFPNEIKCTSLNRKRYFVLVDKKVFCFC